jgi:glucosamine--fructose-6-phosphate aminotransferase (isomerizing)
MIAQIERLPELIREQTPIIDQRIRRLLDHELCLSVKHIVTTGCGDSHMAAVATELAFEQLAGISTEPLNAMTAARYNLAANQSAFPGNPLLICISASGGVARTREALGVGKEAGATTLALTANTESPLASISDLVLDCSVPEYDHAPGVISYRVSMIALFLIAIRLAEVRAKITQDQASALRQQIASIGDAVEATIEGCRDKVLEVVKATRDHKNFVFVGDGPNYSTALFGAAKLLEAAGSHAMGQDTEEWAHLQYFANADTDTPTFVISPGGRGHNRAAEILDPMNRVGRYSVGIVPEGDEVVGPNVDVVLPVIGSVPEMFSPMVYPVATELFAAYFADEIGAKFFRGFEGPYDDDDANTIKTSSVLSRNDMSASA